MIDIEIEIVVDGWEYCTYLIGPRVVGCLPKERIRLFVVVDKEQLPCRDKPVVDPTNNKWEAMDQWSEQSGLSMDHSVTNMLDQTSTKKTDIFKSRYKKQADHRPIAIRWL